MPDSMTRLSLGDNAPLRPILLALAGTILILVIVFGARPVQAETVVNAPCTNSAVQAALAQGGPIRFNCGGPVTIAISSTLQITRSLTLDGGGTVRLDGGGTTAIIRVEFGGGVTLTNLTLQNGNTQDPSGGGAVFVQPGGRLLSVNTVYTNNRAFDGGLQPYGGAIYAAGATVELSGSTVVSNAAAAWGGGVFASTVVLTNSTIAGNSAGGFGGGINANDLKIIDSTFVSNTAGLGSGVFAGFADIAASTLAGNHVTDPAGGALHAFSARLTNASLSGNTGPPGASAIRFSGGLWLTNTTVVANGTAISGTNASLPFTLTNSLIGGPGPRLCFKPATLLSGTNLVEDGSCGPVTSTIGLGPLRDNGGQTWTMAPLPGSAAIGAAGGCLPTDQRGFPRAAPCDVGSYETGAAPILTSLIPNNATVLDPSFTLSILGSHFFSGTVALWNGSPRPTVVVSSTLVTVSIPASDLRAVGVITVATHYSQSPDGVSNSLPFTVTPLSQMITFAQLPDRSFADQPFALTATASSGLPVTYFATGACTVSGVTVTLTALGSCGIVATQAGNALYSAATAVNRTFTITKGSQTITFDALPDRTLAEFAASITATATSGLPVNFSAGGTCTVSGNTVRLTGVGTCTVTATQPGNGNYFAALPVTRTFAIRGAVVTLPAAIKDRPIG